MSVGSTMKMIQIFFLNMLQFANKYHDCCFAFKHNNNLAERKYKYN